MVITENSGEALYAKQSSADTFPTPGIFIFWPSGKSCPEKEHHCKADMEHVRIGHFFLRPLCSQSSSGNHYSPLLLLILHPDSTLVIRTQKSTSLRLAGDDLTKQIPSKWSLIPPEKIRMLSGTPGELRHWQCSCSWTKPRGWRLWRHIFLHTLGSARGHPKSVVTISFGKKSVPMGMGCSIHPLCGGHRWGKRCQPFCRVLGELPSHTQTVLSRGEAKEAGPWETDMPSPKNLSDVLKTYIYFELFCSCHL